MGGTGEMLVWTGEKLICTIVEISDERKVTAALNLTVVMRFSDPLADTIGLNYSYS